MGPKGIQALFSSQFLDVMKARKASTYRPRCVIDVKHHVTGDDQAQNGSASTRLLLVRGAHPATVEELRMAIDTSGVYSREFHVKSTWAGFLDRIARLDPTFDSSDGQHRPRTNPRLPMIRDVPPGTARLWETSTQAGSTNGEESSDSGRLLVSD